MAGGHWASSGHQPNFLGHFSGSTLCSSHSGLLDSGQLYHGCCWFGRCPMVLASQKYWNLLLQLDWTFTDSLFTKSLLPMAFFRASSSSTQCQTLAISHGHFLPSKPEPSGWLLTLQSSAARTRYNPGHLWNTYSVGWPWALVVLCWPPAPATLGSN